MPKTQAVIYARFSPRPNAAECESLKAQLETCRKYCDLHKIPIASTHQDEAKSGADAHNRPGLQDALQAAYKRDRAFVVYSLSRFARSVKDAVVNVERLQKAGANFISVSESIDTTNSMGRFVFHIFAALAELERNQIAERTRSAMLQHQANGRRMSAILPYGWAEDPNDPKRMILDPAEQAVIQTMVGLESSGLGYREICRALEAQDTLYREGRRWNHVTIKKILHRALQAC